MYFAIGVEPTNDTAPMPGCARIASTASLSPCTTLKTPSGRPASLKSSAARIEAEGTFSEIFRMNVLPHAIATGYIHIGTIAGKLNGVMPAHTPTGWRTVCVSTCGADVLRVLALEQVRDAAGELDHLQPALHLAHRIGQRLAVLLGDELRERLLVLLQQREELLHHARAAQRRRVAPGGQRGLRGLHGRVDLGGVRERHALGDGAGRGVGDLAGAAAL